MEQVPWTSPIVGDQVTRRRWGPLVVGTVLGTLVVGVLDGTIAGAAQRSGRLWYASVGAPWYPYSLSRHMLAMTALALLTVAVAGVLTRRGEGLLAGLVIFAVVAGPMAVAGAPVARSLLDGSSTPYRWWSLLVGAVHVAVLVIWAWWTAATLRRLCPDSAHDLALVGRSRPKWPAASVSSGAMFVTVAAVVLGVQALAGRGQMQEDLGVVAMLGWPGMAGWEAITSPFVLSWTSTVAVCAAPLVAGLWRWMRSSRRVQGRRQGPGVDSVAELDAHV